MKIKLSKAQHQLLCTMRDKAHIPDEKWFSLNEEDPDLIEPLKKEGLIFFKNKKARITERGVLRLQNGGFTVEPESKIKTHYPSNGAELYTLLKVQNEILDHFEKKYPEIKHVRAIKLIQAKLAHKK